MFLDEASVIQRNITIAQYEQAIESAFREVADALAVRGTIDERLDAQRSLTDATRRSYDLANARYRSGVDSYLTTLDSQRELYGAQQGLIQTQLQALSTQVTLYKALGGGWVERREGGTPGVVSQPADTPKN